MNKPTMTLSVTEKEKEMLRNLALSFGYAIGRGAYANKGSIQQLVNAIATGEIVLVRKQEATK